MVDLFDVVARLALLASSLGILGVAVYARFGPPARVRVVSGDMV